MVVTLQGYMQYMAVFFPTISASFCVITLIYICSKYSINSEAIDQYVSEIHPYIRRFMVIVTFITARFDLDSILKTTNYVEIVIVFVPIALYNYINIKCLLNTIEYTNDHHDLSLWVRTILLLFIAIMSVVIGIAQAYRLKQINSAFKTK